MSGNSAKIGLQDQRLATDDKPPNVNRKYGLLLKLRCNISSNIRHFDIL